MAVLIGGSPSTGSSLLRRILNRHSCIFCGSESALFCKEALYSHWSRSKSFVFKGIFPALRHKGWHHFRGLTLEEDYGYSEDALRKLIQNSDTFQSFIHAFYKPILLAEGKQLWAEKTPSNVYCFQSFAELLPEARMVHVVRHPLDCIASLVNRGMSVYNATAVYLLNTAEGLRYYNEPNCFTLKYESLVKNSREQLVVLFQFLGYNFEEGVLLADDHVVGSVHMDGWNYRENESIGTSSVGRFESLDSGLQEYIQSAIASCCIPHEGKNMNIYDIAELLDYRLPEFQCQASHLRKLKRERKADILNRSLKLAYFNVSNYPIHVRSDKDRT